MISKIKFSCIIPVAGKDCSLLRKTIPIILENILPENIYIITKKKYFVYFKKYKQSNVFILDEDSILSDITKKDIEYYLKNVGYSQKNAGWYYQQFIKMGFALTNFFNDEFYLSWDADTIPTSQIEFFDISGKPFFSMKNEFHEPYFSTIKKLLDIDKSIDKSFISENMIFSKLIMQNLINDIANSKVAGRNWIEKIINALPANQNNSFSEFETYGTYVIINFSDKYLFRELNSLRDAGEYYSRFSTVKNLIRHNYKYDMVSLELRKNSKFPINIYSAIYKIKFYLEDKILEWKTKS